MEKKLQLELYQKLKELIQVHVASNFGFKRQENGKTVLFLVENGNLAHLSKVSDYLKSLDVEEYPKTKIKHNHGGTEGTVFVSLSKITKESIEKIELSYFLMKEQKRQRNKPVKNGLAVKKTEEVVVTRGKVQEVILAPVVKEEAEKVVSTETKPQRKKRYSYRLLRGYLSDVLQYEGFSFDDLTIKYFVGLCIFCTDNEEVRNLILHASAWYCRNSKAVAITKENGAFCVVVNLEDKQPAPKGRKKFGYCAAPKSKEDLRTVRCRIARILNHDNFYLKRINEGVFSLTFKDKKVLFLQMAMREMFWNIKPCVADPFLTTIYIDVEDMMTSGFEKKTEVKKEEMITPVKPKEDVVVEKEITREMRRLFKDKEDAISQLEFFIGSQEFKMLASELQIELRNIWIKSVREDPKRFAKFLIDYLK